MNFQAAYKQFIQAGVHERNIWKFCNGKIDVLYLFDHIQAHPQLLKTILLPIPSDEMVDEGNSTSLATYPRHANIQENAKRARKHEARPDRLHHEAKMDLVASEHVSSSAEECPVSFASPIRTSAQKLNAEMLKHQNELLVLKLSKYRVENAISTLDAAKQQMTNIQVELQQPNLEENAKALLSRELTVFKRIRTNALESLEAMSF